jgi:DNA-binding MarR family transcriptional regulator
MTPVAPERAGAIRRRQRSTAEIRDSIRALRIQLSLLNYRVGSQLELKDVDLDCFDIIDAYGPLSPSALARRAGLHPATMTGILDRLERGGWIVRERDPSDRRAVVIRARRERYAELMRLYAGMNRSMNKLLAGYSDSELELIADFLGRTVDAGRNATDELTGDSAP